MRRDEQCVEELSAIRERLACIERQNGRLRLGVAGSLAGWGLVVLMGQGQGPPVTGLEAKDMEVSRLALVDELGRTGATLAFDAAGQPRLELLGQDGKPRAMLGLLKDDSPTFGLMDREGRRRVALGVTGGGSARLLVTDREEAVRVALSVAGNDGSPALSLLGKDGRAVWKAEAVSGGGERVGGDATTAPGPTVERGGTGGVGGR